MTETKKLLSGNEALALGAYLAGVKVATAYPGTPSSEILASIARYEDVYAEWSTNEKVAMEVALGAADAGVRSLAAMKHVGLNVAMDPLMAASITGINGGMVVVSADDPGMHSSQNEQDNRYIAKFAKIPMLEPSDSQEACDFIKYAFSISEEFDTPVLVRVTTRISHSKSVVIVDQERILPNDSPKFNYDVSKYLMLPVYARARHSVVVKERLVKLSDYTETFIYNQVFQGKRNIGIITSGVAYQYAREVFPEASFLKLSMTNPLPSGLIRQFASQVEKLVVIEELEPYLEENIQAMGIPISGKDFIPRVGELNSEIVEKTSLKAGLLNKGATKITEPPAGLPNRPPLLCPGCPHSGTFFILSSLGKRLKLAKSKEKKSEESDLIITGDIGCYSLGANSPFFALDTNACMGASIGQALGMENSGIKKTLVAVIGDSTFMHSGITGLINAVYNESKITIIILNNGTTAMTGHQGHPGTGVSAKGKETKKVELESLVRSIGVNDVQVVDAFNIKDLRQSIRRALNKPELSVIISNGDCSMLTRARSEPRTIEIQKCDQCGVCFMTGCSAIQRDDERVIIDINLCVGEVCNVCTQLCPHGAILPQSELELGKIK